MLNKNEKMSISVEQEYEEIIRLNIGNVLPTTVLSSLDDLENLVLTEEDLSTFHILYPIKPTTKNGSKNNSNIGKGEIFIYWLLKYNATQFDVKSNSKTDSNLPDLTVNGIGVEIKSFTNTYLTLGRWNGMEKYGDLLEMLHISTTLSTLNEFQSANNQIFYTTLSINPTKLEYIFQNVYETRTKTTFWDAGVYHKNITNAIQRLEYIYTSKTNHTELPATHKEFTSFFISELIKTKLQEKPGMDGYIVNTANNGTIKSRKICEEFISSQEFIDGCLKYTQLGSSGLMIHFDKLFGFSK